MRSIISQLSDISTKLHKAGADNTELDKFIEGFYDYEKTKDGCRCQLKERGICLHLMNEDADCYDNFDDCYIKKSGLYYCGEICEVVDQEGCEDCNDNQDCGCCEYVQNGSAPYNCQVCARIQIDIEGIGHYCVTPDTSPEEIERIKREAKENPGDFFSCY
ncbi:hypothetical protein [Desulfotomaculum sp. 1211_IL3151]|uniref:hypothetical protein n=1 Tax=Desulfotomaculum sp. 1211_IL3151 TaxID=3084055 RepID=UPI002FDAEF32